jgi:hypothetical protein
MAAAAIRPIHSSGGDLPFLRPRGDRAALHGRSVARSAAASSRKGMCVKHIPWGRADPRVLPTWQYLGAFRLTAGRNRQGWVPEERAVIKFRPLRCEGQTAGFTYRLVTACAAASLRAPLPKCRAPFCGHQEVDVLLHFEEADPTACDEAILLILELVFFANDLMIKPKRT